MNREPLNLINGKIITLNSSAPIVKNITIRNGKIYTLNKPNSSYKTIDLNGATVIPGFIDAHFHIKNLGQRLEMVNLKGLSSIEKIAELINEKSKTTKPGDWIEGFGWDQNLWPDSSFPKKEILNSAAPNNPIFLTRIDGHSAWINDATIKYTQLDIKANINGGAIINDCILIDNAMNNIRDYLPQPSKELIKKWLLSGARYAAERGITNVHDAWQSPDIIEAMLELVQEEKMPIKCYGMIGASFKDYIKEFFNKGQHSGKHYKIRSVKAFIDGALGSRGAALHEPYSDDHCNCGLILISKEEFDELASLCYNYNFQLCTHAIGDRGNKFVLDTYEKYLQTENNRRWRIEHAQMLTTDDIQRLKDLSIIASMQPSHCTSDMKWLKDRIGEHRLHRISRWKTLLENDIVIAGGSDCPIEEGNPLYEYYAAITRTDHSGYPKGGWQSQELLSRMEALRLFTTGASFAEFSENFRGKIDVGYEADLTILSDNITEIEPKNILKTKIIATIVNGKIVFGENNF
ncbi:amidohydrolase [bacterium]|nr:amidohydrolase [bacterium]